ncbi:MAG: helix-turn-helix domain-containing protein [Spirochaetes bacterium]|nr:helix-turn-helix domain-containing protein [Spirochaetota bacterium]MBU1079716.1 helix-turn-helix domain-containing protein [Spirochaetota bacterium]
MIDVLLLDTEDRIKAFTHPFRMKVLHVYREGRRPMTATEVAKALGEGPGKVHYHVRVMEAAGIVTIARTETVNGIVARYYEPAARHYSVPGSASGAMGDASIRDEVARMISRRFRDGLRSFLDSTTGPGSGAAEGDSEAFLFEHVVHCDDARWEAFREAVEDLASRYAEPAPGSRRRRVFIAGATDRPGGAPLGARRRSPDAGPAWPPHAPPER